MKTIYLLLFLMSLSSAFSQNTESVNKQYFHLKLKVLDVNNRKSIEGVFLKLYTRNKPERIDSSIVKNGFAIFKLEKGNDYELLAQLDEYLTQRANFNAACYQQDSSKVFCVSGMDIEHISKLSKQINLIEASMSMKKINLNDVLGLEHIYYDFDKWEIKKDAWEGLHNLIQLLKDNPNIKVELGSHTDSRADEVYNMILSQKRADEAVNFIVKKGKIAQERIIAKGYGETQLLNRCKDGVNCSEQEHALNRRTEIKVLGYKINNKVPAQQRGTAISGARN
ncbi:OmpA family protein [Arcicella rosea]|uniref:Outer membrane protein OmpA-like peptidoglycan-associated protein n=1 Tax=Arcicella rosea TaxID=502909 RepID=A0A841EMH8_9BACT|nr:OmpA family protein [Arcicella rosea]MBB6005327.1 outer membrane protein OmpA-like peptidoglycan-associated protein [Arcicella rosea]